MDVADPQWKDFTARVQAQTLDATQRAEAAKKLIDLQIAKATEVPVTQKAIAEATKAQQEAAGTQPITPQQKAQAEAAANATELTELEIDGKAHKVLVNKRTGDLVKDLGLSGFKPQQVNVNANASLLDRESARFAKPHEKSIADSNSQLEKINEARSLINGPATAQALGIPKVLSALVGGAGSGLRMTKAELDAIAKARGISGDVEGFIRKVSGGGTLTPEQQRDLTGLLDDVGTRIVQKQSIANDALDRINTAGSRDEIVRIDSEVRRKLSAPQSPGSAPAASSQYKAGDTRVINGKTYTRDANGNWK
jgi:ribosomal protein L25 (general stress protein Ctc)